MAEKGTKLTSLESILNIRSDETINNREKLYWYRKAASTNHETGDHELEARCHLLAAELLEGMEKVDALVLCWEAYMDALVLYKFDTSFEWKGETENLDSQYGMTIDRYYNGAVDAIDKALRTKGVDKDRLLERLYAECVAKRNEGGWGADECFSSIEETFRK